MISVQTTFTNVGQATFTYSIVSDWPIKESQIDKEAAFIESIRDENVDKFLSEGCRIVAKNIVILDQDINQEWYESQKGQDAKI